MNRQSTEIVIIGGGLAGAATAYGLTERGARDVLILEGEGRPGTHASGRNAGMIRQVVPDADAVRLAKEGTAFIRKSGVTFQQQGSLLLGSGAEWEALSSEADLVRSLGTGVEKLEAAEVRRRVPLLTEVDFEGAVWCPSDGSSTCRTCWPTTWTAHEPEAPVCRPIAGLPGSRSKRVTQRRSRRKVGRSRLR